MPIFESVVESVEHDIELLGSKAAESTLAATALTLARRMDDPRTSSTSLSMCSKEFRETMRELHELAPPERERDGIDDLAEQRKRRRTHGGADAADSSGS